MGSQRLPEDDEQVEQSELGDGAVPVSPQDVVAPDEEKDLFATNQREHDDVMRAIQLSKAEEVPLSGDGTVLLRLTRMARTPDVLDALLSSPALEGCRNRVTEAGCEVAPHGVCGPKYLVPWTEQQLHELAQEGFEVMDHHILALSSDKEAIEQALQTVARKRRPRLSLAERNVNQAHSNQEWSPEEDQDFDCDNPNPMIVVEHCFATDSSLYYPQPWAPHETAD